jgi:hypothetical protein
MSDHHEVVDLGAGLDARLADCRAIDRRVGAQLDVVFDDDAGDLRDLLVRAVATAHEAIAVAADHDAILDHDAIANDDAFANRRVGVNDAVTADARARADRDVGKDDGAIANRRALTDRDEGADRDVLPERGVDSHRRQGM